jgi:predicted dehydrogenase
MPLSRRTFLAGTAAGTLSFAAPAVHGAEKNRRYKTALIGTGWWGMNIIHEAIRAGRSSVVAMCDVDRNQLDPAVADVEKLTGAAPRKYGDYREMLDEQKPEIVIVATPDHWHPLCMIDSVKAGAHVYVEKPISHTIGEGVAMVAAARDNDRKVQVGTHRRVAPHHLSALEFLREGKLGKVGMIRTFVHYGGGPGKTVPNSDPPAGLDWNMWCGPAPLRPFNKKIHPRGFRRFLDYANGTLGDWGIHWMDQILWWTDEKYPKSVSSIGGRYIVDDNTDAPDTQVAQFDFESFTAVWEHRTYAANNAEKHNVGMYFYGTEGTLHVGFTDGWTFYSRNKSKPPVHEDAQLHLPDHQNIRELWADFLECIETGRKPVCDIEIGHRATCMSLLGMLSWKLGRSVAWDGENNTVPGDPEAAAMLRREYRQPWEYPSA